MAIIRSSRPAAWEALVRVCNTCRTWYNNVQLWLPRSPLHCRQMNTHNVLYCWSAHVTHGCDCVLVSSCTLWFDLVDVFCNPVIQTLHVPQWVHQPIPRYAFNRRCRPKSLHRASFGITSTTYSTDRAWRVGFLYYAIRLHSLMELHDTAHPQQQRRSQTHMCSEAVRVWETRWLAGYMG